MTNKELIRDIKGVFKLPKKRYYFGKVRYGSPYMFPWNYCGSIIRIRNFKPQYNRLKYFKFGSYFVFYGYPIKISKVELGWKDKFNSPRFEWSPQFHIYAFGLQFCIFWNAPGDDVDKYDVDKYYEMILHYLYYSDKDIKKAESTWGWINSETKQSTWNKNYLINSTREERKQKLKKLMKN